MNLSSGLSSVQRNSLVNMSHVIFFNLGRSLLVVALKLLIYSKVQV